MGRYPDELTARDVFEVAGVVLSELVAFVAAWLYLVGII